MPTLFFCSCGKHLSVPDGSAGKKVRCPACGQVSTVPSQPAPEDPALPEVVPVVRAAPRQEIKLPRTGPHPPPLPPPDFARAAAGGGMVIQLIELTRAGTTDEIWQLELGQDEVSLIDDAGDIAVTFPRSEANNRFTFPSFWFSVKHLQIRDEKDRKYDFRPDKDVMAQVRSYLDRALREDPEARRRLTQRGLGMMGMGALAIVLGAGFLVFRWATGALARGRWIGGSIAGIIIGLALVVSGINMCRKAARMGRDGDG
jgi:hypothetical protein